MARHGKKGRNPKVSWPDLRKPPESWSYAEARGVRINPIVTGIGRHPRSISDEDWVLSCERDVEENGLTQFLTGLLHVLRLTIPGYPGKPPAVGTYPQRMSEGNVPLPDVSYPGDREWSDTGWSEEMVGGIICNPVYAGFPVPRKALCCLPRSSRLLGSLARRRFLRLLFCLVARFSSCLATRLLRARVLRSGLVAPLLRASVAR